MKLYNKSGNGLLHVYNGTNYYMGNGKTAEVPKAVADIWLKIKGVEKYIEPEDLEKAAREAEEKAKAERKALEDENRELKKKLEELKKTAKAGQTTKGNKE